MIIKSRLLQPNLQQNLISTRLKSYCRLISDLILWEELLNVSRLMLNVKHDFDTSFSQIICIHLITFLLHDIRWQFLYITNLSFEISFCKACIYSSDPSQRSSQVGICIQITKDPSFLKARSRYIYYMCHFHSSLAITAFAKPLLPYPLIFWT